MANKNKVINAVSAFILLTIPWSVKMDGQVGHRVVRVDRWSGLVCASIIARKIFSLLEQNLQ